MYVHFEALREKYLSLAELYILQFIYELRAKDKVTNILKLIKKIQQILQGAE